MKKSLILTEKPSVALDFVKALNKIEKFQRKDGYYESASYIITYAIGHLLTIDDKIAPSKWTFDSLPILPKKFLYTPVVKTQKQFFIIKKLLSKASKVIIATDAGREGELIARLILKYAGWSGNTYRIWTSEALSSNVILRELKNLKPIQKFNLIFEEAIARQHADWLIGINLTRAVTLKNKNNHKTKINKKTLYKLVWTVGRVQTPVLAMLVKRHFERENFKPEKYFIIEATLKKDNTLFKGYLIDKNQKLKKLNEKEAEDILKILSTHKQGQIVLYQNQKKSQNPPLLHSLTSLQREANILYNFTAQKTLAIAQSLYETYKVISYPRTDSQYLDETPQTKGLVVNILKKLNADNSLIKAVNTVGKRIFNKDKLTDHYAIIPLGPLPQKATEDEKKIYNLIKRKFVGAFMPNYEYNVVNIITSIKDKFYFRSLLRWDLQKGWSELYDKKELNIKEQLLKQDPQLSKDDILEITNFKKGERITQPPPLYTEAILLKEMEKLSLGTPATRAGIIENLKKREYILLKKRVLIPTQKGIALIKLCGNKEIVSPEFTSQWEKKLAQIRTGENNYKNFTKEIKDFVISQINYFKQL